MKTMVFENGRVIIRGTDIPAIEPTGDKVDNERLQELFLKYEFLQDSTGEEE